MKAFGLARLGRDAEIRTTSQGESVATLALAFSYGRKGSDGNRTELPLTPYRCNECGQWHVGTRSGLKRPVKTIYDNHQLRGT